MSVAHDSREFPSVISLPPDVQEFERSAHCFTILVVAEPMRTNLNCTVVFDGIYLEAPRDDLTPDLRRLAKHLAEILHCLRVVLEALVILIKLEIGCEECLQRHEIPRVEGSEQEAVHTLDFGLQTRRLRGLASGLTRCDLVAEVDRRGGHGDDRNQKELIHRIAPG